MTTGLSPVRPVRRSRVVLAAGAGNLLEWYDFAIYGALATVLAREFFPSSGDSTPLLAAFAVYAAAFVMRPVGAVLFGRWGDAHQRSHVLAASVGLMTAASACVGLLPGYGAIGLLAPVLLVLLRAVQGLAAGGELGVAVVFLVEAAPVDRRGGYGGWHSATMSLGTGLALATGGVLAARIAHGDISEDWWRLAFLAAAPLGLVAVHLRRNIAVPARSPAGSGPGIRTVFRAHRRAVMVGFLHVAPVSAGFNLFFIFLPSRIAVDRGTAIDLAPALACATAGLGALAVSAVLAGAVADRVGRRRVVVPSGCALALLTIPLLLLATSGSVLELAVAEVVAGVLIGGTLSVALLAELFPRPVRSRALALTAGLSTALVGGTTPLLAQIAANATGSLVLPGACAALLALAAAVAVGRTAETAFRPFD